MTEQEYKKHAEAQIEELEIQMCEELDKATTILEKAAIRDVYRAKKKYWTARYTNYETAQVSCDDDECLMCGS